MMDLVVLLFTLTILVGGILLWWFWRSTDTRSYKNDVSKPKTALREARRAMPDDSDSGRLDSNRAASLTENYETEGNSCAQLHDQLKFDKNHHDQHPDTGSETEVPLTSDCFLNDGISTEQLEADVRKQEDAQLVSEKVVSEEMVLEKVASEGGVPEKVASCEQVSEKAKAEEIISQDAISEKVALDDLVYEKTVFEEVVSEKTPLEKMVSKTVASEDVVSEEATSSEVALEEAILEGKVRENAVSAKPVQYKAQCVGETDRTNTYQGAPEVHQEVVKEPGDAKEGMSECSKSPTEQAAAGTSQANPEMASSTESQEPSQNRNATELKKKLCWVKARALERLGVKGVEFVVKQTGAGVEKRKRRRQRLAVTSTLKSKKDKSDFSGRDESEWQSEEDTSTEDEDHGCYDDDTSVLGAYASRMIENPEEARIEAEQLKAKGNVCFKEKQIDEALQHYTEAIVVAPTVELLSVLLSNRAACFTMQKEYANAVDECTDGLSLDPTFAKLYLRRFRAYEAQEKWHDALTDINKALELDPSLRSTYRDIRQRVEKLSQEEFERQKQEMLDKLKTFGNWALGKVGLSMDNFKLEQNPETGSYNISFQQNTSA